MRGRILPHTTHVVEKREPAIMQICCFIISSYALLKWDGHSGTGFVGGARIVKIRGCAVVVSKKNVGRILPSHHTRRGETRACNHANFCFIVSSLHFLNDLWTGFVGGAWSWDDKHYPCGLRGLHGLCGFMQITLIAHDFTRKIMFKAWKSKQNTDQLLLFICSRTTCTCCKIASWRSNRSLNLTEKITTSHSRIIMHYYHSGVDFTCDHDLTCTVAQCAYVKIGSNLIAAHVSQSASHPVIVR